MDESIVDIDVYSVIDPDTGVEFYVYDLDGKERCLKKKVFYLSETHGSSWAKDLKKDLLCHVKFGVGSTAWYPLSNLFMTILSYDSDRQVCRCLCDSEKIVHYHVTTLIEMEIIQHL